jgi:hypothetical protein
MSRVADQIVRSIADHKRRGFEPRAELPHDAIDFDDAVDRMAALLHRADFMTALRLSQMGLTADGQAQLASTWQEETPGVQREFRLRAAVCLEFAVKGRELRERPEENRA